MDFELSSEFSRILAIPHFTIFAKKSESTRLWFQETLGTKLPRKAFFSIFEVSQELQPDGDAGEGVKDPDHKSAFFQTRPKNKL